MFPGRAILVDNPSITVHKIKSIYNIHTMTYNILTVIC